MPVNANRNDFAENSPKALLCALQEEGSARKLSRRLKVNIYYVTQLIYRGIEPTDKTAKGRAVRRKLFLDEIKPRKKADEHTKRIRRQVNRMARETKKPDPSKEYPHV